MGDYEDVVLARPVKFGLELVHICSPNKLCMGKVGNTKVCLETLGPSSTRCSLASHATKVAFNDNVNSFLLVKVNEKAAFCQPCLLTENLATTLVDSLLGRAALSPVKKSRILIGKKRWLTGLKR